VERLDPQPPQQQQAREKLWREFFSDPSQWWDCRPEKNARPDFKRKKKTHEALWLGDRQTPTWLVAELAAMLPGTLQLDSFSWNRKLARHGNMRRR
jgi:hypothetical protein